MKKNVEKNADDEEQFGEDILRQVLSEFSCERNQDVEDFLKRQAIDFTNKHQSVTYLVFATDDAQLLGYFALTIKPITVSGESFSNTVRKKLSRVSVLDEEENTYSLAAYLIAQL
ncbi:MAG: GNAT family acetyltransferase, partial [Spirochaetales bacterium]|nr:GNAT family acetyltransferase [Spirochaetales bacterium]